MSSPYEDDSWSALRLDTPEGHGLIRPRFQIHFAVEYPEPATVQRFHDAVIELLGDSLTWISTGSGRWTRRTARTDSMVATWCRDPVFWPKKVYTFIAQDSDQGVGDAKLEIYYAARDRRSPSPEWLPRLLQGAHLPKYCTRLSVALPVRHELVTSGRVVDWIRAAAPVHDASFIGGSAGWAIDVPLNPPLSTQGPEARARAGAMLQRHPGLTCFSYMGLGLGDLKWDLDFARAKSAAAPRPYVRRADWITLINGDQLALLGGASALRAALAQAGDSVVLEQVGLATLIRAGREPQLGDLSVGYVPAEYRAVARALAPVSLSLGDFRPQLGQAFDDYGLRAWYDALAKP